MPSVAASSPLGGRTQLKPSLLQDYNSFYKVITEYRPERAQASLAELATPYLPPLWKGKYRLLGVDYTSYSRPYAFKLAKQECVYKSTPITGQKPITYGHQFVSINQLGDRKSQ